MAGHQTPAFGELLKHYRLAAGLTQEQLAEKALISGRAISDLERGINRAARRNTLRQLLTALALSPDQQAALEAARLPVYQVVPEGEGAKERAPLQPSAAIHRTTLPDEPTPFIGREQEIRRVAALLRASHGRMVTLTGPGGTGKSRLALQVGAAVRRDFSHGVFFVDLASLTDSALVPAAIAEILGVQEARKDLVQSLVDAIKDRRLLLVLDNYEHLLDAAWVAGSLLDGCRELHLLVTSRIPLHLTREHEYPVPPLSVPDPRHLPDIESLARFEAIALFVERARAVNPGFAVTEENGAAIAEICYRLDGLPLAIELAAARSKLFPPPALLLHLCPGVVAVVVAPSGDQPALEQCQGGPAVAPAPTITGIRMIYDPRG